MIINFISTPQERAFNQLKNAKISTDTLLQRFVSEKEFDSDSTFSSSLDSMSIVSSEF